MLVAGQGGVVHPGRWCVLVHGARQGECILRGMRASCMLGGVGCAAAVAGCSGACCSTERGAASTSHGGHVVLHGGNAVRCRVVWVVLLNGPAPCVQALERKQKLKTDAALDARRHTGGCWRLQVVGVLRRPGMHATWPSAAVNVRRHCGGTPMLRPTGLQCTRGAASAKLSCCACVLWRAGADSPLHLASLCPAVRALSCFQEAVMLCNTAEPGWPMLYCNDQWCSSTGA